MNKTKIKQQFIKWLTMFVAKPNKAFNNMPICPYALEALQKNKIKFEVVDIQLYDCLLYTSPSPRDGLLSRMPSSA